MYCCIILNVMHNNDGKTIAILKALADPTRLEMVRQLAGCPTGKKSCGDLSAEADLSQPAMSHHFGKLVSAGVVLETKDGVHKNYTLNKALLDRVGINPTKL